MADVNVRQGATGDAGVQKFVWLIEYGLLNVSDDVAVFADDFGQCHFPDLIELRL